MVPCRRKKNAQGLELLRGQVQDPNHVENYILTHTPRATSVTPLEKQGILIDCEVSLLPAPQAVNNQSRNSSSVTCLQEEFPGGIRESTRPPLYLQTPPPKPPRRFIQ